NVTMWWWDAPGTWTINASIDDLDGNHAFNSSTTFAVGSTTGFLANSSVVNWPSINPGATNVEALTPMLLNNTGNEEINVEVNATNLTGDINPSYVLGASNFSVHTAPGCGGTQMFWYSYTTVAEAVIPRGNYSINDGTAQETIYFCLEESNANLIAQAYSTAQQGAWTIRIFLAVLSIRRRKKRNSNNPINITIPATIFSKELGALEALSKYMKENLGMSYHKIAELLNRDQRTIWTAYNKAIEKQKEQIKVKETEIFLPISILNNRESTILESAINYLRKRGMKYSEIAKLLDRDPRNIWTIYSKTIKKQKDYKNKYRR
ncbi:MAG: hypothetical protein NTZ83_06210, partial [Candidatus Pacearchaeota archaeon]|nr:hypothetical protein [Candidatus Pacearchaeota archaeon]